MTDRYSPTIRRRRLSAELRRLREASRLTAEQVGDKLGWSRGRLTNMELNKWKRPDPVIIRALATLYQAPPDVTEGLVLLARQSREKGWWTRYGDVFTDAYVGFEAEASAVSTYQTMVIPGLLQTQEYAAASTRSGRSRSPEIIDRVVQARLVRQEILDQDEPPKVWCVLDESVLLRPAGDRQVMRDQIAKLMHLIETADHIKIQLLPLEVGLHPGIAGSFTILDFTNPLDPSIAYIETRTDGLYLEDDDEVQVYRGAWDEIRVMALHPDASADRMGQIIKKYE
ncbi:helix-turn-helix transcriptional regulator [Nocardiopsis tropica]|uniref:Helix-turn-helix transcriptional regulator n=1 Tax=Streptomonospora nanhaiensis TaxID=1323731 RepID=A0ABY6YPS6_9ACTN|nr:helix-turn-helix transcriptional regulator [Streptomonospora nanhaiensis]MEE2042711.1 helix-turn-helix transcriptional regulator [Nocardiopsis tropica]WAE74151.1 helix-turn-helix transcriptional regulator [Streptomonospora nanhaiensis]